VTTVSRIPGKKNVAIGWYEPAWSHLNPAKAPTIKKAHATPPNITFWFQGDLMANRDPEGQKKNMGIRYSGR